MCMTLATPNLNWSLGSQHDLSLSLCFHSMRTCSSHAHQHKEPRNIHGSGLPMHMHTHISKFQKLQEVCSRSRLQGEEDLNMRRNDGRTRGFGVRTSLVTVLAFAAAIVMKLG